MSTLLIAGAFFGGVRQARSNITSGNGFSTAARPQRSERRPTGGIARDLMQTYPSGDSFKSPLKSIRSPAAGTARHAANEISLYDMK